MARLSIKSAAAAAKREEDKTRKAVADGKPLVSSVGDSFTNFAHRLGVGADNPLSGASYGFNPITRNRTLLEWIHRGSWIGGIAVDAVADDMTRAGIEYVSELPPGDAERLDRRMTALNTWSSINEVIRWGRLYGGCLGVVMIDGQDLREPLRLDSVGPGMYRGLLPLDRWMVEPSLEDLVTVMGPHLGLPKYYRVSHAAPALRGCAVHHSRVAFRHVGIDLPYSQRLMENLWGISILERLYDRMIAFDSASTGAAQLVYKAYLRTFKIVGLRDIVAAGGPAMEGLAKYTEIVRRFQGMEGITMLDAEDTFEAQGHSAFSGLSDALVQFGQQLSGALQIPLVRLFGQSPAGLNSTGESDWRMYYDNIKQQQMKTLHHGCTLIYALGARSEGITLPPNFAVGFKSLWELSDTDKANVAKTNADTVSAAHDSGLISPQTALKELRQSSRITGVFTNITEEMINEADDQVAPPPGELAMPQIGPDGQPISEPPAPPPMMNEGEDNGPPGQNGEARPMDQSPRVRKPLQLGAPQRRQASGPDSQGAGPGRVPTQRPSFGQGAK